MYGSVKAVEIKSVESDLRATRGYSIVVGSQPSDKIQHVGVTPHPRREALEIGERINALAIVRKAAHVAIDAVRVGPIGFDGNCGKPFLLDEPLGNLRTFAIELV